MLLSIDKSQNVKLLITDFNVSKAYTSKKALSTTHVGTPFYMAPEVFLQDETYDSKADIWSVGVIFYQLLFGKFVLFDLCTFLLPYLAPLLSFF